MILLIYVFQRSFIYLPSKEKPDPRDYNAHDMKVVSIMMREGHSVDSWFKSPLHHKPTILFLHGNAGHIGYRMPIARHFIQAGLGVLLLEYRGYGGNKGNPTEQSLYEDARAGMQFLLENNIHADDIVIYGESLGSAVGIQLALEYPVCALILQSPFTSLSKMAQYHYPWMMFTPWDKFNSIDKIQSIKMPLLVIHAKLDNIVPYSQGLSIYSKAPDPKEIVTIQKEGVKYPLALNNANCAETGQRERCTQ